MKRYKFLLFLLSVIFLLNACNQIEEDVPATVILEASKTSNIKKGEPVIFKFNNIPDESDVLWKIKPDDGVNMKAGGNTASVLFNMAGDYTVNGTYGNAVVETDIETVESTYNPSRLNFSFGLSPKFCWNVKDKISFSLSPSGVIYLNSLYENYSVKPYGLDLSAGIYYTF